MKKATKKQIVKLKKKNDYSGLAEIAKNDPDWIIRRIAVWQLKGKKKEFEDLLRQITVQDRDENVRDAAQEILGLPKIFPVDSVSLNKNIEEHFEILLNRADIKSTRIVTPEDIPEKEIRQKIEERLKNIDLLLQTDFPPHTKTDPPALKIEWYKKYKDLKEYQKDIKSALEVLYQAMEDDPENGLHWFKYGAYLSEIGEFELYANAYLTGAYTCDLMRTSNLQKAGEVFFHDIKNLPNALNLFISVLFSVTKDTKGFGMEYQRTPDKI